VSDELEPGSPELAATLGRRHWFTFTGVLSYSHSESDVHTRAALAWPVEWSQAEDARCAEAMEFSGTNEELQGGARAANEEDSLNL